MTSKATRRNLLIAGGAGLVAAGALPRPAQAHAMTDSEKANVKFVTDFVKGWEAKKYDADKEYAFYLAPEASVRMEEDKPPLIGPAAVAAESKKFMAGGARIEVKIHDTFARGPVVVNARTDIIKAPGKPDQEFKVAGVFVVKKGKIAEWTDYLVA